MLVEIIYVGIMIIICFILWLILLSESWQQWNLYGDTLHI